MKGRRYGEAIVGNERIPVGRRNGIGCLPLVAGIVAAIIILVWNVGTAARTEPKEAIAALNDEPESVEALCGLNDVVCPGEQTTTYAQDVWIGKLEQCESSGNPDAVNPNDLDGTPSYGAFQFKPSTFAMYVRKYGISADAKDFMNRSVQRNIVERMMNDGDVRWTREFPDCVRKLGRPPTN